MGTAQPSTFGALLKHYRLAAGLTQEALAERARLSVRGLSDLEHGRTRTPRPDTLTLLVTALGLSARERAPLVAVARGGDGAGVAGAPAGFLPAAGAARGVAPPLAPLVGRQGALDLLDRHLAGEGPPLLLLAGEPGIGKTRLLQEVAQRAVAQGLAVLTGGCPRRGGQEPYAPLLDALEQYIRGQDPLALRRDLQGCAWLMRLLPELADGPIPPLAPQALPSAQERRLLFGAVRHFLANVAGPAGTLLLLDDLQWAGSDALDLLGSLVRSTAAVPPRVVGAYRDTEVQHQDLLAMLRADLAQAGLAAHQALGPLAAEDAARLLDALLANGEGPSDAVAARVLRRAGGTPFFLVSYAQALRAGSAEAAETVPWDLAQGVRQRVALLPAGGREVLDAAAIVGRKAPHALLVAALGQPEEVVLDGLEAACRARLLLEEGDAAYAFAHDVIREVVEADVGTARRALLHRRVAQALEAGPAAAPSELLAYHYARSGVPEKAVSYLERAGDHAWAQRAHGAAERQYREALGRLETLGRAQDAARVREKLGEVLCRAGRYNAAIQVLEPAVEALRAAADWEGLGRVAIWIGRALHPQGTPREGITRLTALLELLERSGASASTQAALYAALGQLLFIAGQFGESVAISERAAALARTGGDDRTGMLATALASWSRVHLLQMQGRLGEALRLSEETLSLVEALGDPEDLLLAHRDLAYSHALRGAVATAGEHLACALAVAEPLGEPGQAAFTLALRGWLAFVGGDWPGARVDLDQALVLSRQIDPSPLAAYPLILRARLSLAAGDRATAAAGAREALALAVRHDDLQALRWASMVVAELDMLEGHPAAAGARLSPLLDRPGLEDCDVTVLLPLLAWAYLEQGQLEQAAGAVGQALARARREEMRLVLVEALRIDALIAIHQQRWAAAEHSLEDGITLTRGIPHPYAEARLLHVWGRLHVQKGEPEAARERLEAALALFQRLEARMDVEQTERALTTLPGTPPGAAPLRPQAALAARHAVAAASPADAGRSRTERQEPQP